MEHEFEGRAGAIIARRDVAEAIFQGHLAPGPGGLVCCNTDGVWAWLHTGSVSISSEIGHALSQSDREWVLLAPGFGRVLTRVYYRRPSRKARSAWDSVPMARQDSICPECGCDCGSGCDGACDRDCDSCDCEPW